MANYVRKEYQQSDKVNAAQQAYENQQAQKPADYVSRYQQQLNDLLGQYQNRKPFSYDLNTDALYQQYKGQYVNQGRQAMMDTMGQASALTGGYGNSYAQTAGQQTYRGYLQGLNDKVPQLYQMALDRYNQQGNDLLTQYGLLKDQEQQDYSRYQDSLSAYQQELARLQGAYESERSFDYGQYGDAQTANWNRYRAQVDDDQWMQAFLYQQERDRIADEQWRQQFAENQRKNSVSQTAKSAGRTGKTEKTVAVQTVESSYVPANSRELAQDLAVYRRQAAAAGVTDAEIQKNVNLMAGKYYQAHGKYA